MGPRREDYAAWFAADEPGGGAAWLGYARALLVAGDLPTYEKLCQRVQRELDHGPHEPTLWSASRIFGLGPVPSWAAHEQTVELASRLAGTGAGRVRPSCSAWPSIARGSGPTRLDALARSAVEEPDRAWVNLPLRALIHHRMGRAAEARSALNEASQLADRSGEGPQERTVAAFLDPELPDFLILHAEAKAQLAAAGEPSR